MDYIIKIETILIRNNFRLNGMRLLSSEANQWKSRVVNEAEQMLVRESAETAHRTTEVQKTMDKQFQTRWKEAKAQLRDMRESNSALARQRSKASLQQNGNCVLQMRDAWQLEAQTLRMSQDTEQQGQRGTPKGRRGSETKASFRYTAGAP